jgi:hypothetical protein
MLQEVRNLMLSWSASGLNDRPEKEKMALLFLDYEDNLKKMGM